MSWPRALLAIAVTRKHTTVRVRLVEVSLSAGTSRLHCAATILVSKEDRHPNGTQTARQHFRQREVKNDKEWVSPNWSIAYYADGKLKRETFGFSKREAAAILTERLKALQDGTYIESDRSASKRTPSAG